MKKIICIVLVVATLFMFSSCSITEKTEINQEGKITVKTVIKATEDELDVIENVLKAFDNQNINDELGEWSDVFEIKPTAKETIENFKDKSVVTQENGVNVYTYQSTKEYSSTDQYNKENFPENDKLFVQGKATVNNYWRYVDNGLGADDASIISNQVGIDLSQEEYITMPQKITKTNCKKIDDYTVKLTDKTIVYIITEKSTASWTKSKDPYNTLLSFVKNNIKPKKVTNLKVYYVSKSKIKITWKKQNDCDDYVVEKKIAGGKWKKLDYSLGKNYAFDNYFLPDKTTYYRVRGYNYTSKFTVYGNYSNAKQIKTANLKIKPKITVTAKTKKATISLKEKVKNVSGFEIKYSQSKKFKKAKIVYVKKLPKTIKNLKSKKTYYFSVRKYKYGNGKKVFSPATVIRVKIK